MGEYVPKLSYLARADFEALGGAVSFSTIPEWGRTPTPVGVTPPRSYEGGCATGGAPGDGAEAFPQDGLPYLLRDAATGRYLDTGTGGVVQTQPDADGDDRQWRFLASGSGAYRIDNGAPGRGALDAHAGGAVRWGRRRRARRRRPAVDRRGRRRRGGPVSAAGPPAAATSRLTLAGTVTWTASASAAARWEPVPAGGADRAVASDDGELVTFAVEAARPNPFRTRATIPVRAPRGGRRPARRVRRDGPPRGDARRRPARGGVARGGLRRGPGSRRASTCTASRPARTRRRAAWSGPSSRPARRPHVFEGRGGGRACPTWPPRPDAAPRVAWSVPAHPLITVQFWPPRLP